MNNKKKKSGSSTSKRPLKVSTKKERAKKMKPTLPAPVPPPSMTINDVIDDCLVPVLAHVPFTEQITTISSACSRWNSLIGRVHQKRNKLVLWDSRPLDWSPNDSSLKSIHQLFSYPLAEQALSYPEYLDHLFNETNPKLARHNPDFYILNFNLKMPKCIKLCETFPNLTDLSLVKVCISSATLTHLLEHFHLKLHSLYLQHLDIVFDSKRSDRTKIKLLLQALAAIDSMISLRRLAIIGFFYWTFIDDPRLDLSKALASVLPRLEEFTWDNYEYFFDNVPFIPFIERLDGNKVKRLSLRNDQMVRVRMLCRLVLNKPGFASLTHLTLSFLHSVFEDFEDSDYGKSKYEWYKRDLRDFKRIVKHFPQLVYLDIITVNSLGELLPHLCKLKHLVTLKLNTYESELLRDPLPGMSSQRLAKYFLESVKELTLSSRLRIEHFHLLALVFPQLERLYLSGVYEVERREYSHDSTFYCKCKYGILDGKILDDETDDESSEVEESYDEETDVEEWKDVSDDEFIYEGGWRSIDELRDCECKTRLIDQLGKFKYLPKVTLNNK